MKVRIISVGDEILYGQVIDSNSAYIAQKLNSIGLEVDEILSIHDDHDTIIEALIRLIDSTDVIIMTGGLGPTKDDLTKKAIADFLGVDFVMDESVLNDLKARFEKLNRPMNDLNRDQALMPKGSISLKNPLGTAPGIWSEFKDSVIINLPGVPFEMKNLMKTEVLTRLQQKFELPFVVHRFLSVSNFPESDLALTLEDWESQLPKDMHLAYLPERGKVKLRITTKGESKIDLENRIETEVQKILPLLSEFLDSDAQSSVEEIVGQKLKDLGLSISTAESCTGGTIAQMITSVPGCSAYFKGSVVSYATEVKENLLGVSNTSIKQFSVVSEEVAVEMANGVRNLLKTDLAVATTGVAGPAKGEDGKEVGTVWMAVGDGNRVLTKSYFFPYLEREDFISQVSKLALQLVLRFLKVGA